MIKCVIVDDEPLAQDVLENYIARRTDLLLVSKCNNALDAFNVLHTQQVDLILLDIQMPAINGIDFIRSLKNPPRVIFTTAFADYAVNGFELDAVDYLLKPISSERFDKAINKLLKIQPEKEIQEKDYTYFKVSGRLQKVFHADLVYAQSVKDYILLCTTKGNYLTHMTMKYLDSILPVNLFLRIHRSYIVNKTKVTVIDKTTLKVANEALPIGDNYKINIGEIS